MSIEKLQQKIKDIILGSMVSFTTTNNGEEFCSIETKDTENVRTDLLMFRSMYLSFYGLKEEDIEGLMPSSLMFHAFGIKDRALTISELGRNDEDFIGCLISLYRQCGLTEIKKDE